MSDVITDDQVDVRLLEYWRLLLCEINDAFGWSDPAAQLQALLLAAAVAQGEVASLDEARAIVWRNCGETNSARLRTRIATPTPTYN